MNRAILQRVTDKIDFSINPETIGYLNIYNYSVLRKRPEILHAIDKYTLDGIMLSVVIFVFFGKIVKRQSPDFSSYFSGLFDVMNTKKHKVFFIGGTPKDIGDFVDITCKRYPNLELMGFRDGYSVEEDTLVKELKRNHVQITIIGMGTPKQEELMLSLRKKGYQGKLFSCGAFFTQTARKGLVYYPKLISQLHLRWAYRIYEDPKLFRRYAIDYPIGIFYLLKDRFMST